MKRLWIAVTLLVVVFAASWANTLYLERLSGELTALLTEAEAMGETGHWDRALELTQRAEVLWEKHDAYLHVTLRHVDTDNIFLSFQAVKEYLQCQEAGEYSAASAMLLGHIRLLYEQEEFNLKNLL